MGENKVTMYRHCPSYSVIPKVLVEIILIAHSGEMAALSNHPHLCDSPHDPTHPHLCVLPLPLHLSGAQEEADKVIGTPIDFKRNFFLQEGWWVGGAGRDIFRPLLGSWQVIHWRQF